MKSYLVKVRIYDDYDIINGTNPLPIVISVRENSLEKAVRETYYVVKRMLDNDFTALVIESVREMKHRWAYTRTDKYLDTCIRNVIKDENAWRLF